MVGGPIGLGEAERVRGELAARIRLPGWYVVAEDVRAGRVASQ